MTFPLPHRARQRALQASPCALAILLAACGGGSSSTDMSAQADPGRVRTMAVPYTGIALTPVTATASGSERADLSAAAAIDHDENTRWGSAFSDDQNLVLDYGRTVTINRVRIDWERAHAASYLLQVSTDGTNWATIRQVDASQGGVEDWTGLAGTGRYLRMQGVKRSTDYGYSIFEIQAFTGSDTTPAPAPLSITAASPGITRMMMNTITATPNRVTMPITNRWRMKLNIRPRTAAPLRRRRADRRGSRAASPSR